MRGQFGAIERRRLQLEAQFPDDEEAYGRELRAVCKEAGYNPLWVCVLPVLNVAFWVLVAIAIGLFRPAEGAAIGVAEHTYSWLPQSLAVIQVDTEFLWMDLTAPDPLVMPALTLAIVAAHQSVTSARFL